VPGPGAADAGALEDRGRGPLIEALNKAEHAANLSRYLPGPVARIVAAQGLQVLSHGRRQEAAVLFADIVGFTRLAERLPPEAIGQMRTEIRQLQREAIEHAGGIIDQFIGDAVMAVFGVPEPDPRAASAALEAAAALEERIAAWMTTGFEVASRQSVWGSGFTMVRCLRVPSATPCGWNLPRWTTQ
jgi:class 3 adenylate cyclase